jgi:hypothetical protein
MRRVNLPGRLRREGEEIAEELKAGALAFLGVELGGENVLMRDGRGEGLAMLGAGGDDGGVGRLREIAVNEVEVGAVGDIAEEGAIGLGQFDLVPADLGDLQPGRGLEANDGAGEDAEAGGATIELGAAFEQGLVTDADPEERSAGLDELAAGIEQFLAAQGMDAIVEAADAGQDGGVGGFEFVGAGDEADVGVEESQGFLDAAQVTGPVIDERNHGWRSEQALGEKSNAGEIAFGSQAELAAGGFDVVTFFAAERGGDALLLEGVQERFLSGFGGALPGEAVDVVIGDEIDFGVQAAGEAGEWGGVGGVIVDAGDEDVFEGEHASFSALIGFAGGGEFREGILAIDGHDPAANVVRGAMEGDGQTELFGFSGQSPDLRGEAAGGDGDLAGADGAAPRGIEDAERDEELFIVGQGFAHAHDDQVVDATAVLVRVGWRGGSVRGRRVGGIRLGAKEPFGGEDLADDFGGVEVAFPSVDSAGAEGATIGAADLGGDAEGVTVAGLAVEGGVGWDQNAFDEVPIAETPEEFPGGIGGALVTGEFERMEGAVLSELGAEGTREVGHGLPVGGEPAMDPVEDLGGAIGRLVPVAECDLQFSSGAGLDIVFGVRHRGVGRCGWAWIRVGGNSVGRSHGPCAWC